MICIDKVREVTVNALDSKNRIKKLQTRIRTNLPFQIFITKRRNL